MFASFQASPQWQGEDCVDLGEESDNLHETLKAHREAREIEFTIKHVRCLCTRGREVSSTASRAWHGQDCPGSVRVLLKSLGHLPCELVPSATITVTPSWFA